MLMILSGGGRSRGPNFQIMNLLVVVLICLLALTPPMVLARGLRGGQQKTSNNQVMPDQVRDKQVIMPIKVHCKYARTAVGCVYRSW